MYVADMPNTNLKAIKVECIINATMSQLKALLMDAKAHEKWVYNTKTSYTVKQISDDQQIYYSEVSMPWPVKNRDVVIDLKWQQDVNGKKVRVTSTALSGYVPENDAIRVKFSNVLWIVTPVNEKQLQIEYTAQADPGGTVPAWLVNMFCTKGPYETFKNLRILVSKY